MLSKDQIKSYKPQLTEVEVGSWGGSVFMRQLSAANVLLIQSLEDNRAEFLQTLALTSIVDEEGQPLFDETDKEFLADQPVSVYNDLVQGFLRANHLTDDAVDELKKTSEETALDEPVIEYLS